MIERAPKPTHKQLLEAMLHPRVDLTDLLRRINDEYSYWSKVKYKAPLPEGLTPEMLWAYVKASRKRQEVVAWASHGVHFALTEYMQRTCQEMDMNFGGLWEQRHLPNENERQIYLVSSLMEEAISSSQMEGASTTRKVAKAMLRQERKPRDKAQQMIANNYRTIRFITEHQDLNLTPELLLHLHALMTEDTLERVSDAGRLRTTEDDVVVEDSMTQEVVHRPPAASELLSFVEQLCAFFNDQDEGTPYMHPIIRGIIIHFMIGYMHPFVDGNGRTARALFYWYMMRRGYWLTQYLSISRIIQESKASYEQAYLHAEADGLDMGYFITYHLRALALAFKQLQAYIERKRAERSQARLYTQIQGINERQAELIQMYINKPDLMLTAKEVQGQFLISAATAKSDLDGLLAQGIISAIELNKIKRGYVRSPQFDLLVRRY